jgi:cation diffusion facilitator family transporter
MTHRFGHTELPPAQEEVLRRAVRLEWITIAFLITAASLVYAVLGTSQAMRVAWVEDLLSLAPPIAFLVALRITRRPPNAKHPYGFHRSIGVGHLVAAVALTAVGGLLVYESGLGLVRQEHPTIGVVEIFGNTIWLGWLMIAALAYTAVPPVILGRMKMKLAEQLHDKVLFADADMNKADWMTAVGAMIGVLGIGLGIWWTDGVAAVLISMSILHDGVTNLRAAVTGLMDARATTFDDKEPHPLIRKVDDTLAALPWVREARSRVRDEGHVFHVESFVVPRDGIAPSLDELDEARRIVADLDWKLRDVVVIPVATLPEEFLPGLRDES